jgi:hypothetical protein
MQLTRVLMTGSAIPVAVFLAGAVMALCGAAATGGRVMLVAGVVLPAAIFALVGALLFVAWRRPAEPRADRAFAAWFLTEEPERQ